MKPLTITGNFDINVTAVTNEFIDSYMPSANGEFVKAYLFLARHLRDSRPLTPLDIADELNQTEKDVYRALRYWQAQGLLALTYSDEGELTGIDIGSCQNLPDYLKESPGLFAMQSGVNPDSQRSDKELKDVLFVAEQYLGKTLTKTEAESIIYLLRGLGMSADLIEYLIESCVEHGHKSMHYIQKVGLSWHKDNVTTLEQAKLLSVGTSKSCYVVLNAFGIKNRGPAPSELAFIRRWTEEMGFPPELIRKACDRTIIAVHTPSFEYADTILSRWKKNNVHTLKDLIALDEVYLKEKTAQERQNKKNKKSSARAKSTLQQRSYDMDSLEDKLLKNH